MLIIIYIITTIITLFLSYFVKETITNYNGSVVKHKYYIKAPNYILRLWRFSCCLPLLLVSALRVNVGTDYIQTYYKGFIRFINGNDIDHFEIGYKAIMILSNLITSNPQVIFMTTSFLFVTITFYAIYNESPDILYSIFLLIVSRYFFISMNMVKQFIAMAIMLYSIKYLKEENDKYKFWIFFLIAASIHYSAIVCATFWIISKINISKWKFWGITTLMTIFYFIFMKFDLAVLIKNIFTGTKYHKYFFNSFLYAGNNFAKWTFILNVCILIIFYIKLDSAKDYKYSLFFNIQLVACILCVFMPVIPLVERIYFYFGFIQIVSIPYILGFYSRREQVLIKLAVGVVLIMYCYIDIFVNMDHEVFPYYSIFSV